MLKLNVLSAYRGVPKLTYLVGLSHLLLEMCFNFLPVVYPILILALGLTYGQVGVLALIASTSTTLVQPAFGALSDRLNRRGMIVASLAWIGGLMALIGYTQNYWLIAAFIALGGLGSACFHPAAAALAASAGGPRRGASMAVFSVSGNLGVALSPLLMGLLLARWGLPGTAALALLGLGAAALLGWQFREAGRSRRLGPADAPTLPAAPAAGSRLALALVVLFVMARSWFQGSLYTYLPSLLQESGFSLEQAGALFSALLFSASLGSLMGGPLSDTLGRLAVVLGSLALLGPASWAALHTSGALQVTFLIATGVLLGASVPVGLIMAQEAWPRGAGLASSLAMGLGWLPSGVGAWVVGRMADQNGLPAAMNVLAFIPLVGMAFGLGYGWSQARRKSAAAETPAAG
ncbi:MAG: MFS transporter [Chloroflexi bacterium]|nr:MFS transporter [Chloroflexota bacterium]